MRYCWLVLSCFLIFCCCKPANRSVASNTGNATTINNAITEKDPNAPNVYMLRKKLFNFFETHRHLNEFDTTDYTYCQYEGVVNFPPYAVRAGHLFNDTQFHAMIFYSDDIGAGMFIYVKNKDGWKKIFEDTTIDGQPGSAFPSFTDWNRDGIKDITILHSSPASIISNYNLWLLDKKGDKLYRIDSFSEIPNPEIENATNHVISYSTCGCADNCMLLREYAFKAYTLQQLYDLHVACCGIPNETDSECKITYTVKNKESRPVYSSTRNLYKHVPKTWQAMMREKYNSQR